KDHINYQPSTINQTMRTGKIARLPDSLRQQLNQRLRDGEEGATLLRWLNSLPKVKSILDAHFDGQPISPSNLTQWLNGGFRDWEISQKALELVGDLQDKHTLGHKALDEIEMGHALLQWVGLHYAASAKALVAHES